MTAPAGRRWPRAGHAAALPGRLLRLELRHTAMAWMVPLLGAVFWLDTYRPAMGLPPLWSMRGPLLQQQALLGFAPLMAGIAAWAGSREGRHRTADLVTVTPLPRWPARVISLAATACWAVATYLACTLVLYGITAGQARWGGPMWWPVAVGVATVTAASAAGFAAGAHWPARLTGPAVSVATFGALAIGVIAIQTTGSAYAQISPLSAQDGTLGAGGGIFYPYPPGLPIVQVMFLAGLAAAAAGTLGLPAGTGGRSLRTAAAAVTAAGVAAASVAAGLAGTARLEAHGVIIPVLHGAGAASAVPYTPVCGGEVVPVCVHPAYRAYLAAVTTGLEPVLRQVAGLPGAPVRAGEAAPDFVANGHGNGFGMSMAVPPVSGHPPVFHFLIRQLPGTGHLTTAEFTAQLRAAAGMPVISAVIGRGSPAQQAVTLALLKAAGATVAPGSGTGATAGAGLAGTGHAGRPPGGGALAGDQPAVAAAARRFEALPAAARHAWLLSHLAALRTGRITLKEVP